MKRVGVVTFHSVDNHGAVLQAYSLQSFLEQQGHEVEIIDYRPRFLEKHRFKPEFYKLRDQARRCLRVPHEKGFEEFRKSYLRRSRKYDTLEELRADPPNYDVYVCGSDQVWSPIVDGRNQVDLAHFLDFGSSIVKRVSYAASFGARLDDIPERYHTEIKHGLTKIDSVGVREKSGVEIVKQLVNKDAVWCLDPVFLLSENALNKICVKERKVNSYAFVYMVPTRLNNSTMLGEFAKKVSIKLIHDHSRWKMLLSGFKMAEPVTPLRWLSYVRNAQVVITSSFHGVACSIINKRSFIYIRPVGRGAALAERVVSLLNRLGLTGRCIVEDCVTAEELVRVWQEKVDWLDVESRLATWRDESKRYLLSAIMGDSPDFKSYKGL